MTTQHSTFFSAGVCTKCGLKDPKKTDACDPYTLPNAIHTDPEVKQKIDESITRRKEMYEIIRNMVAPLTTLNWPK